MWLIIRFVVVRSPDETRCLVTRQVDHQWSSFVYWIVRSTFIAESKGISFNNSNEMPAIGLFGPEYRRMFRDVILNVGNYGEMYEWNLGKLIPREGLNLLNTDPVSPRFRPFPLLPSN